MVSPRPYGRNGAGAWLRRAAFGAVFAFAAPAFAQVAPDDIKPARDVLAALEKKDYAKARSLADEIKEPLHKKALLWHLAQTKDVPFRFTELAELYRGVKGWPLTAKIAERAEDQLGSGDGDAAALAWFAEAPPRSAKGWVLYVSALARAGKEADAAAAAKRAWTTALLPAKDEADLQRRFAKYITPDDDRLRVFLLLRNRRTEPALALWGRAILPAEDKAAVALRIVMQGRGGDAAAIEAQIARLPAAVRDETDFRFDWMSWHRRAARYEAAGKVLERPGADDDDSRRWRAEGSVVVRELIDAGKADAAYKAAAAFASGSGETWATMEFLAGWIALRKLDKPAEARAHFERLFRKSGASITRGRGAYWSARAASAMGDKDGEAKWLIEAAGYPQVFYGQLAIAALGRDRLSLPADATADETARKTLAGEDIARAAMLFQAIDAPEPAHALVLDLVMDAGDAVRWAAVAEFSTNLKRTEAAVRAARRASVRSIPLYGLGYPLIELPVASKVEPAFALSIIRQESEFYVAAMSPSGARGLMQLMPPTARETAQQLKLKYELDKLTRDEAYNMRLGTEFLFRLVQRYGGSYPMAAAAYNAGPGNLNKWLAKYGDPRDAKVDLVDWIESIPFEETRNYVQRVMENLTIYRNRAGLKSLAAEPGTLWRPPNGDSLKAEDAPPPAP